MDERSLTVHQFAMKRLRILIAAALIVAACLGVIVGLWMGSRVDPVAPDPLVVRDPLIVLDGSQNVSIGQGANESWYVSYVLRQKYPASSVIDAISTRLRRNGWHALEKDWLNPDFPSSHVRGWTEYVDATVAPNHQVHHWLGQWEDADENIAAYSFEYRYPVGVPNSELWVNGAWFPASARSQYDRPGALQQMVRWWSTR